MTTAFVIRPNRITTVVYSSCASSCGGGTSPIPVLTDTAHHAAYRYCVPIGLATIRADGPHSGTLAQITPSTLSSEGVSSAGAAVPMIQ